MLSHDNIHKPRGTFQLYMDVVCSQVHKLILEEIRNRDRKEKASTDSVRPGEHFKDKPVDVSCGKTDKTQSGTGDAEK